MKKIISIILCVTALMVSLAVAPNADSQRFDDVVAGSWYENAVNYVAERGYFSGTSASTFSPSVKMNRAMFATVLSKVSGDDLSGYEHSSFDDVADGEWYTKAVSWASDHGIVSGVGNNRFAPDASITRQTACLMLLRFIEYKQLNCRRSAPAGKFSDDASIAPWASEAVYAIRDCGIISGKPNNSADPDGTATRAEVAQMIMKLDTNTYDLIVDRVDIQIDGAVGSTKLVQMSDIHLTVTDDTDSDEAKSNQAWRSSGFEGEITDGVTREDRFVQFVDFAKQEQADFLALTGDIIDAPSNGNINFLRNNLLNKDQNFLFVLGNHDWTGDWLGTYQSAEQRQTNIPKFADIIGRGEDSYAVREIGGVTYVAIDNSNDQITNSQYSAVRKLINNKTPFILLLHVPLDADSPSLATDVTAKWGRPIMMGNSATSPTTLTKTFVNLLKSSSSTCKAIICGHIHMDHVDRLCSANDTVQYCLGASYQGYARVFTIHG